MGRGGGGEVFNGGGAGRELGFGGLGGRGLQAQRQMPKQMSGVCRERVSMVKNVCWLAC